MGWGGVWRGIMCIRSGNKEQLGKVTSRWWKRELSAERGAGAHLAGRRQGHMKQQEAFKLLWLLQCSRKGGRGTLSHEGRKLLRPTCKELHLHFQVTDTGRIKHTSWVMEKVVDVMKCYHRAPALHPFPNRSLPSAVMHSPQMQQEFRKHLMWSVFHF